MNTTEYTRPYKQEYSTKASAKTASAFDKLGRGSPKVMLLSNAVRLPKISCKLKIAFN